MSEDEELLIDRDDYLAHGVHIGTKAQHNDMEDYIFHVKKNQLAVINLEDTDVQIRKAAEKLAEYEPEDILVIGRKDEAKNAIDEFSKATGVKTVIGRFMPGSFTNPESENFTEPEIIVVTDPETDAQAIREAAQTNKEVISIADSENKLDDIDLAIPANNKSEKSIGMVYYLLAREMLEAKGMELKKDKDLFTPEIEREEDEEE
ncbi:30S ribosomal protein S2 [Candidatus Nanohalobium constans]|uniref:Small ribosomal subunit protein uS2 n=1 Tax=Candidatus Nanohalobium constans TaxID=2565781 RepID=A0A5Q0UF16_9ARCH|nr:30S ribosomal protein S2 [Candidatus Nanohalobium constans]QGA80182.1 30S ribosomal protein S2 [Candidatus Nanohalobium constans]